jgi:uncharacterized membrane protein
MLLWLDALLAAMAVIAALVVRPWRALPASGPPWPWLAWCALLPLLWSADRLSAMPLAPALPGSGLLLLMMGWPLAVLGLLPVAALTALLADLPLDAALHRLVWLGLVPATLALGLGAGIRRWLPHHLFVYIFARGFFATAFATSLAGIASALLRGAPEGTAMADLMLARGLVAWGDAFLSGMITAIFVAFHPQWLATYADRIYLPIHRDPPEEPDHGTR